MIYKFFPKERIEFPTSFLLRFTPPFDLNDPVECRPLISYKDTQRHIDTLIQRNLDRVIDALMNTPPRITRIQAERATKLFAEEFRKEFLQNVDARREHDIGLLMRGMSDILGILSLTKNPCNQLMWSHYGSNGEGYLIGFDESHEFFKRQPEDRSDIGVLQPVVYCDDPVEIVIDFPNIPISIDLLYRKKICWSYEGEFRLVRELAHATATHVDSAGRQIHLFQVPHGAVKEFVLGYRADASIVTEVEKAVNASGGSIKVRRAVISLKGKIELK